MPSPDPVISYPPELPVSAARDEIARVAVHERDFPFHPERGLGGTGEYFCRNLHWYSLTGSK